ncbi:MAG TPA: hypothetical protein VMP03_10860, partial [Methylomirabilota bacterium]|nr:hypothetical protein [Methylomirabilota bacterium]
AGSVGLLAMTRDARGALARATPPPPIHGLIGIGIDTADFVLTGPASAALTTARGVTLLAAAAGGVPAFERRGGPATTPDLAASRADGFAWALVEDRDPPSA